MCVFFKKLFIQKSNDFYFKSCLWFNIFIFVEQIKIPNYEKSSFTNVL